MKKSAMNAFANELVKIGAKTENERSIMEKLQENRDKVNKEKAAADAVEQTRQWGLTPGGLRLLFPGGGLVTTEFSGTHHTINNYFRIRYPCISDSALAAEMK